MALVCAVVVGSCSENSPSAWRVPTEPPLATVVTACSAQGATQISGELNALYPGGVPSTIANQWQTIQSTCGTNAAKNAAVLYVAAMLAVENPPVASSSRAAAIAANWADVYTYAGYSGIDVPNVSGLVLQTTGGAKVVNLIVGGFVTSNDGGAILAVDGQQPVGVERALFTIEPTIGECFLTNLNKKGTCYLFSSFPSAAPFNPKLLFGVCLTQDPNDDLAGDERLGHEHGTLFKVLPKVVIPAGFDFCEDVSQTAWLEKHGGPVGRALASVAKLFLPTPALASHGGLGGEDDAASPVGGVNTKIFDDDFNSDPIGSGPGAAGTGTWTFNSLPPSWIRVLSSIGDLTDKPVVINQAGGNCNKCGTLFLTGTPFNSGEALANSGSYFVTFEALQSQPSPKDAPLVFRGQDGRELARLGYHTVQSTHHLYFDDADTGVPWVRDKKQLFELTIDLDAKQVALKVDGAVVGTKPFYSKKGPVGADLWSLGWELTGIDAGVIGWDNIHIYRNETP